MNILANPEETSGRLGIHNRIINYVKSHGRKFAPKQDDFGSPDTYFLYVTPRMWFEVDMESRSIHINYGEKVAHRLCDVGADWFGFKSKLSYSQYMEVAALLP